LSEARSEPPDGRAEEGRAVAQQLQRATGGLRRNGLVRTFGCGGRGRTFRQARLLAEILVGDASESPLRKLREHERRGGRELDLEPRRELGDPRELVRCRRAHGPAQTL